MTRIQRNLMTMQSMFVVVNCALLLIVNSVHGFTVSSSSSSSSSSLSFLSKQRQQQQQPNQRQQSLALASLAAAALQDPNGNEFTVGSVVRVAVPGLKAYQVPPKGKGSFHDDDDTKAFEPAEDSKYLSLPVGLRGEVIKLYQDMDAVSANFPVQVKFTPGSNVDEGFDAPVPFLMHFDTFEIEVVLSF